MTVKPDTFLNELMDFAIANPAATPVDALRHLQTEFPDLTTASAAGLFGDFATSLTALGFFVTTPSWEEVRDRAAAIGTARSRAMVGALLDDVRRRPSTIVGPLQVRRTELIAADGELQTRIGNLQARRDSLYPGGAPTDPVELHIWEALTTALSDSTESASAIQTELAQVNRTIATLGG